jgi:hypothetical protein
MTTHLCKKHWDVKGTHTRPRENLNFDCLPCWLDWLSMASDEETFSLKELSVVLMLMRVEGMEQVAEVRHEAAQRVIKLNQPQHYPPKAKAVATHPNWNPAAKPCTHCGAVHVTKLNYCPTCTRKYR